MRVSLRSERFTASVTIYRASIAVLSNGRPSSAPRGPTLNRSSNPIRSIGPARKQRSRPQTSSKRCPILLVSARKTYETSDSIIVSLRTYRHCSGSSTAALSKRCYRHSRFTRQRSTRMESVTRSKVRPTNHERPTDCPPMTASLLHRWLCRVDTLPAQLYNSSTLFRRGTTTHSFR